MVREPLPDPSENGWRSSSRLPRRRRRPPRPPNDFDYVADLLRQCVTGDPGNAVYVRAYIENLQKKYGNSKKVGALAQFKERGARSAVKKALAQEQWDEVVKQGLKVLTVNPWDLPTLTAMATAAAKSGDRRLRIVLSHGGAEGRPEGLCLQPPHGHRHDRARTDRPGHHLVAPGRGDSAQRRRGQAVDCRADGAEGAVQRQVRRRRRGRPKGEDQGPAAGGVDPRTAASAEDPATNPRSCRPIWSLPSFTSMRSGIGRPRACWPRPSSFPTATSTSAKNGKTANSASCGRKSPKPKTPRRKRSSNASIWKRTLEFYRNRVERYPNNLLFKYELGYRYMKLKRYDEAIRELQVAKNDPRRKGAVHARPRRVFPADQAVSTWR